MVQIRHRLAIEPMREGDIPVVQAIERDIFSTPWPRNAYHRELASKNSAHYIVLRRELDNGASEIVGSRSALRNPAGRSTTPSWRSTM